MSNTPSTPTIRLVPGAPPPAPVTKSQKKKHKAKAAALKRTTSEQTAAGEGDQPTVVVADTASAALIEQAPSPTDIKEGAVADQLIVTPQILTPAAREATPLPDGEGKMSPIVDLVNKRLKVTTKKLSRIQNYSITPPERLNEDQRRSLKTIPVLEGVQKELEEVKKAVEVREAELEDEIAQEKAKIVREQDQRVVEAVAAAEATSLQKTTELFTILQLQNALANGTPEAHALNVLENEAMAIFSAVEALLSSDLELRMGIVKGLLSGEGEWQGVPFSRFSEIAYAFLNPPRAPTPPAPEPVEFIAEEVQPEEPEPAVGGLPSSLVPPSTSAFNFVQEDELEVEEAVQDQEAEEVPVSVDVEETVASINVNGHTIVEESVTVTTTSEVPSGNAGINWADEEDAGLPSIASLHDKFGSSATGTPAAQPEPLPEQPVEANGQPQQPTEDDGFQSATRGRGRGRGGYRGERGGYRGFRGGERGSYRGRGERGGYRGERGGFRGGRGEWRGGEGGRGDWRGGEGGDRPRGRGRGRGNYDRGRGGFPPAAAAAEA